jgi:hypothetical protein
VVEYFFELDPLNIGRYARLPNIYATVGSNCASFVVLEMLVGDECCHMETNGGKYYTTIW